MTEHRHTLTCSDCGWSVNHSCNGPSIVKPDHSVTKPRRVRALPRAHVSPVSSTNKTGHTSNYVTSMTGSTGTTPVENTSHSVSSSKAQVAGEGSPRGEPIFSANGNGQMSFIDSPEEPKKVEPEIPERLQELDAILKRASKKYRPTQKFYDRLMDRYSAIPERFLDFGEQADGMVTWLREHPRRYADLTDLCRFAERWMVRASEDAAKVARANGIYIKPKPQANQSEAQSLRMGGGLSQEQDSAVDRMEMRGRTRGRTHHE